MKENKKRRGTKREKQEPPRGSLNFVTFYFSFLLLYMEELLVYIGARRGIKGGGMADVVLVPTTVV
jgi:hypothetical protein